MKKRKNEQTQEQQPEIQVTSDNMTSEELKQEQDKVAEYIEMYYKAFKNDYITQYMNAYHKMKEEQANSQAVNPTETEGK